MKDLDNNTIFLSKSSPIKFFCTNIEGKKMNILVDDERDIDLIKFLIQNKIFKSENNILENISKSKKEIFNIMFGEPLNESIEDFNINIQQTSSAINNQCLELYKKLSDKSYADKYIEGLGIKQIKTKIIHSSSNYSDIVQKIDSLPFPYVIKTFNGKGGKGTFIINSQNELENVKCILSNHLVWSKSENISFNNKIILIEKYISNKIDININLEFYEVLGEIKYHILGITQQLTEGTLYRGNTSIENDIPGLNEIINKISQELINDGYKGNIGIDLMLNENGNIYFNEFNTRFNSSTLFTQYIKNNDYKNAEIVLFETRNGNIDLEELKSFSLKDGIKGNLLPYEVNWDKGTIVFLLKGISTSRFLNKNILVQNNDEIEIIKKRKLLKIIRENGFFEVRFDICSKNQTSSQKYYEQKEFKNLHYNIPLVIFTGPRGAGKNYFSEQLLSLYSQTIDFVPQISCREKRDDDNSKYIKIVTKEEFIELKEQMFVSTGNYGILKKDIEEVISLGKIPIFILGWREILKLEKEQEKNLLIFNITYPINSNGTLDKKIIDTIKNERFQGRGWDEKIKNENIVLIKKYMNLFFNHPTFKRLLDTTHITTINNDQDFISSFGQLTKEIFNKNNILTK